MAIAARYIAAMLRRSRTARPDRSARSVRSDPSATVAGGTPAQETGFDPDAAATGEGLFGLSTPVERAKLVVIPVPFDATTSYRPGTAAGPAAVLDASRQVDLEDLQFGPIWKAGIAMLPIPRQLAALSKRARSAAEPIIRAGGAEPGKHAHRKALAFVNESSEQVHRHVAQRATQVLDQGAIPALLGGDHASPFGLIEQLSLRHPGLGVLQIDAHADLREQYEGFTWSHASIFHNVMTRLPGVARLVQVGVRDFGAREQEFMVRSRGRVRCFHDQTMRDRQANGGPANAWTAICREIVQALPKQVYISFDIDGLTPDLCPNTGTPVPGGLTFPEACHLLAVLARSGRRVVGFDLCEVAPASGDGEWNANVGARVLYKLIGCALTSQGLLEPADSRTKSTRSRR